MQPIYRLIVPMFLAALFPHQISAQNGMASSKTMPILVELFTSQGCSSCPPAEKLLGDWGMDLFLKGRILPLAFHVDYWNYLGWKDPYSSELFTDRQKQYALALGAESLYTPQMVVSGKSGFVGSDAQRAQQEVTDLQNPKYEFSISLSVLKKNGSFHLATNLQPLSAVVLAGNLKVFAVVFENSLSNQVPRGENAGRILTESFVVRSLTEINDPDLSKMKKLDMVFGSNPDWVTKNCGIAVFVQDMKTMEIKGLNWVYPLAGSDFRRGPTGI